MVRRGHPKVVLIIGSILLVGYLNFQGSPNLSEGREKSTSNGDGNLENTVTIMMKDRNDFKEQIKTPPVVLLFNSVRRFSIWGQGLVSMGKSSLLHLPTCPHRCHYSFNRNLYEETANLVVVATFYLSDTDDDWHAPQRIKARQDQRGQIWLGVNNEAPLRQCRAGVSLDGVFNWISTYRRDADIYWPYGQFFKHNSTKSTPAIPWKRKKLASWLVSNSRTNSMRRVLVRNLQRFIPVDVYGKFQKLKCPPEQDCRAFLGQNYKFYMAFENSLCLDYVTEKVFNAYNNNLVPVIYAWLNDSTILPPGSYINALDFSTPKDLADYLRHLDSHEDEYLKYFEWKRNYELKEMDAGDMLCQACVKLHEHLALSEGHVNRYSSMQGWLSSWERKGSSSGLEFKFGQNTVFTGDRVCVDASFNPDLLAWLTR